MLPCAFKQLFGIDCPGCGFQRSFIALLRGNFAISFSLYPATILVLVAATVSLLDMRYHFDTKYAIKKKLLIFTLSVIFVSYVNKMVSLYLIH